MSILATIRDMFAVSVRRAALSIMILVGASQFLLWSMYWSDMSSSPPTFSTLLGQLVVVFALVLLAFWINRRHPANEIRHSVGKQARFTPINNPFNASTAGDAGNDLRGFRPIGLIKQVERELLTTQAPSLILVNNPNIEMSIFLSVLSERMANYFCIITQNIRSEKIESVPGWMANLRMQAALRLGRSDGDWTPPRDWLSAWRELQEWLQIVSTDAGQPLILALNDIETLHILIASNPEKGDRLLSAIRSFSQHHDHVLFLFVINNSLSVLTNPSWSKYFVHFQVVHLYSTNSNAGNS